MLLIVILTAGAEHSYLTDDWAQLPKWPLEAKNECGVKCVVTGGLLSRPCVEADEDANFSFLKVLGELMVWGAIGEPESYPLLLGTQLVEIVEQTCNAITPDNGPAF